MANTNINIDISRGMVLIDRDTTIPYVVDKIDWNDSNDSKTVVIMDLYRSGEVRHEKITFNRGDLSEDIANKYQVLTTDTDFKENTWSIDWDLFNKLDIDVYPVTIKSDRYNGTYNGGYNFHAWSCEEDEIPEDIDGCDVECTKAWYHVKKEMRHSVGFGRTPSVALLDAWFKQYGIDIEDYKPKTTVEVKGDKIIINPVNERPIEIDMETAKLIREAISSGEDLHGICSNLPIAIRKGDNERVTDIAEMEEEPYNDGIDPEWYTMRLEELDVENAALMVSTYVSDYDSDLDTGLLETEGSMLIVTVINKKTHNSDTVFWNVDETFRVFKERLIRTIKKVLA